MMGFIKKISMLLASLSVLGVMAVPAVTMAQTNTKAVCEGLALTGGKCGKEAADEKGVASTIKTVISILSLLIGVVAVIMIIIGGFKYIISLGDSSNINSAKNTILYALIGLVVVALAQIIVRFVLTNVGE